MPKLDDLAVPSIRALFRQSGHLAYGERVTQLEHALQCAALAERDCAGAPLIVAALLHDVGHLLHRDAAGAFEADEDDLHEAIGAKFLARWLDRNVTDLIGLHVQTKRYLCAIDPGYQAGLSAASKRTLSMQGGSMSPGEVSAFSRIDDISGAIMVRRWDDLGKVPGMQTPPLEHYVPYIEACTRTR